MITQHINDPRDSAQFLINQHIKVTTGRFAGSMGTVQSVMADGRSLDVALDNGKSIFVDITMVRESRNSDL